MKCWTWVLLAEFGSMAWSMVSESTFLGFFAKWHINLWRLFNAKAILAEKQLLYYLTHSWEDKRVKYLPQRYLSESKQLDPLSLNSLIMQKFNTLASTPEEVQHISHYTRETPLQAFRLTWPCLIVEVLETWVRFLEQSVYCVAINCTFTFHTSNVFGYFYSVQICKAWILELDNMQLLNHMK